MAYRRGVIALLLALLVVVVGLAVAIAIGRIPVTGMDDAPSTSPFDPLPEGQVTDDDLQRLRFDQTLRGYRMSQVDATLDRLRDELRDKDREIARLRGDVDTYAERDYAERDADAYSEDT
ncbi:hypothetical protein GCM10025872_07600 [Barrientosiimonas endolithica]|uniref:DivIVA domain-containing protein n=1 Tax=Barrientosiimonas endolithica TaxID=1535208 RepID=A0ABN6YIG2_9MICO|nr:hypothetical protein GCM10025872_07600 [Barrientosiimonas endolithica]